MQTSLHDFFPLRSDGYLTKPDPEAVVSDPYLSQDAPLSPISQADDLNISMVSHADADEAWEKVDTSMLSEAMPTTPEQWLDKSMMSVTSDTADHAAETEALVNSENSENVKPLCRVDLCVPRQEVSKPGASCKECIEHLAEVATKVTDAQVEQMKIVMRRKKLNEKKRGREAVTTSPVAAAVQSVELAERETPTTADHTEKAPEETGKEEAPKPAEETPPKEEQAASAAVRPQESEKWVGVIAGSDEEARLDNAVAKMAKERKEMRMVGCAHTEQIRKIVADRGAREEAQKEQQGAGSSGQPTVAARGATVPAITPIQDPGRGVPAAAVAPPPPPAVVKTENENAAPPTSAPGSLSLFRGMPSALVAPPPPVLRTPTPTPPPTAERSSNVGRTFPCVIAECDPIEQMPKPNNACLPCIDSMHRASSMQSTIFSTLEYCTICKLICDSPPPWGTSTGSPGLREQRRRVSIRRRTAGGARGRTGARGRRYLR